MYNDTKGIGNSGNDRNVTFERRNFHAHNREELAKTNLQKSQEMKVSSIWKMRRKT
jgi:hypothetical protein